MSDLIQSWLEVYTKDQDRYPLAWFPTRLVDLGTIDEQCVKLIDTRDAPPQGPYATLSHRWADSVVIQTTSSNIKQFMQAIPVPTLSRTFQDAFTAARLYLGVRYIWIDSLCIIQDDPDDWRVESLTMQDVYSYSFCNLSAIATSSGAHGLYPPRDPDHLRPCKIETNCSGRDAETYVLVSTRPWDHQLDYAPLSRRGWVFQERWLTPRVLHFGSDQLLWECCELNASEVYPHGIPRISPSTYEFHSGVQESASLPPNEISQDMVQRPLEKSSETEDVSNFLKQAMPLGLRSITHTTQSSFKNRVSVPVPLQPSDNYKKWHTLVEWYSSCMLTMENDKLVAFSGVAKRFHVALGGLWRSNLPNELIWRVGRSESDYVRSPAQYRSPSWSWASVDTQVIYSFVHRELFPAIDVIDCHIDTLFSDPFGQVAGGWIRVRGTLHPALLYRSDRYTWDLKYTLVLPQTGRQLYAMPDAELEDSAFSRRAAGNPIIRGDRSRQMDENLDFFEEGGQYVFWYEKPLYLLPVVSDATRKGTFGIVLERIAGERGTYKRWGWFEEAVTPWRESSFDVLYWDERKRKKLYLNSIGQELKIV